MEERKVNKMDVTLLALIDKSSEPIGCWALTELANLNGIQTSTATMGRKLREFDIKGYTEKASNKGRILTERGRNYLMAGEENLQREKLRSAAIEATTPTNMQQLKELLIVRKCLETEIAYQAALSATEEEQQQLIEACKEHRETVTLKKDPTKTALEFHMVLAVICHNKLLRRLMRLLIYEEQQIENTMDTLITRERGPEYSVDHEEIKNAVISRKAEEAREAMNNHIQKLIDAVSENTNI